MGSVAYLSFSCAQVLTLFFAIVFTAQCLQNRALHWGGCVEYGCLYGAKLLI